MEFQDLNKEVSAYNYSIGPKGLEHYDVMYHVRLFLFMSFGSIIIVLGVLYIFTEIRMRRSKKSAVQEQESDRTPLIEIGMSNHLISTKATRQEKETFL